MRGTKSKSHPSSWVVRTNFHTILYLFFIKTMRSLEDQMTTFLGLLCRSVLICNILSSCSFMMVNERFCSVLRADLDMLVPGCALGLPHPGNSKCRRNGSITAVPKPLPYCKPSSRTLAKSECWGLSVASERPCALPYPSHAERCTSGQ